MRGLKCVSQFNYSLITPNGVSEKTVKNRAMRYRRAINRKARQGDPLAIATKSVFEKMYRRDEAAMKAVQEYLGHFQPALLPTKKSKKFKLPA